MHLLTEIKPDWDHGAPHTYLIITRARERGPRRAEEEEEELIGQERRLEEGTGPREGKGTAKVRE